MMRCRQMEITLQFVWGSLEAPIAELLLQWSYLKMPTDHILF